jgi:Protein of unknown function (DUF1553)/Protein of unknown function (DUF1549)/Planctomycete cytochrome C
MMFLVLFAGIASSVDAPADTVDYMRDVKPILARCYACHGAVKQRASLRLDTAAFVREGGANGAVVVPGNADASLLIKRILGLDKLARMPPLDAGEALKPAQVTLIRAWINQGATGPKDEKPEADPREHWAFKAPVHPDVPKTNGVAWVRNPIDAFIAAAHQRHGLIPQTPAARGILLRRVYLDLIGLPPTPDELRAFLDDPAPDAYEKVVDRLLARPQYGERWGRHWMDVWRYSDWWGLGQELRNSQKHMWHWRDWIVESLNRDKGYDRMLLEMLAGDELYPADADAVRGTGFLARHYFKFNRTTWLDETIEHTAKAFLGLTMNCAKCHDHKYDPISQVDYYRFRAFFEPYQIRLDQARDEIDFEKDGVPRVFDCHLEAPTFLHMRGDEQRPDKSRTIGPGLPKLLAPAALTIEPVALPCEAYHPGLRPFILDDHLKAAEQQLAAARSQKTPIEKAIIAAQLQIDALKARAAADRAAVHEPDGPKTKELAKAAAVAEKRQALAQAEAALARAEMQQPPAGKANAQQLQQAKAAVDAARKALADPDAKYTPLAGALKTLESNLETEASRRKPFPKTSTGRRSALARWLADARNPLTARVAVNHIWARHMGQPLVPSVFDFGRKGTPPTHPELLDWLAVELIENGWSMKHLHKLIVTSNAYRMSSSLAGSAPANRQADPDNRYLWRMNSARMDSQAVRDSLLYLAGELDVTLGGPSIVPAQQEQSRRRSLYFFHSAIDRNRFLTTFDEADPLECYRRRESIIPQQALALSNSQLALTMAAKVADRLSSQFGDLPDRPYACRAFVFLLAATPVDTELAACERAMRQWRELYAQDPPGAVNRRVHAHLVHALLNHNDFVSVR